MDNNNDSDNDMDILGKLLEESEDGESANPRDVEAGSSELAEKKSKKTESVKEEKPVRTLKLTDIFSKEELPSVVHSGDTDSSDDEENKYSQDRQLNEFGKSVKDFMKHVEESRKSSLAISTIGSTGVSKSWKAKNQLAAPESAAKKSTVESLNSDPICGIRVVNPVVSSAAFQNKLEGRKLVMMSYIQNHINNGDLNQDWVTVGVIVQKSAVQKSQKGSNYCIITLSDLKIGLKKVSLFLFSGAFKTHWKESLGTVVGILNPSVLNNRDSGTIASLSIDNAQKLMVIGKSKDFGYCRSWKKNGEKCTAFVNLGNCEYCVYHVQKEYKKFSGRSELQSPSSAKLHDLQNKVLGKNEKDEQRLQKLTDFFNDSPKIESNFIHSPQVAGNLGVSVKMKDVDRLNKLMDSPYSSPSTSMAAASTSQSVLKSDVPTRGKSVLQSLRAGEKKKEASPSQVMKNMKFSEVFVSPKLGRGVDGSVDLDFAVDKTQKNRAMSQALLWVKKNGPLKKDDPNAVKKDIKVEGNKAKRKRDEDKDGNVSNQNKSPNIDKSKDASKSAFASSFSAEKIKEIMEKSSKHTALLEIADLEAEDVYFDKLEKKEQMEEKMLSTYKLECKACKYLAFSASDLCKSEGHPIKVVNGMKRFFKCHDCGNRTISLELFPTKPCQKCGGAHWEKTAMMREKKGPALPSEKLSIRGNEEAYIGTVNDGNLNLLVPE
ncbi:hypothetical protein J437_LFUL002563 [Ladona fulva]|uniref:Protein MCM10 homolog n=1 Tax=Ladona fulva TaxID=123851 RepID=A0A8K0K067_LADFU|nr:hypothetical protein J437_LFUL002563 [Ladona fulva]